MYLRHFCRRVSRFRSQILDLCIISNCDICLHSRLRDIFPNITANHVCLVHVDFLGRACPCRAKQRGSATTTLPISNRYSEKRLPNWLSVSKLLEKKFSNSNFNFTNFRILTLVNAKSQISVRLNREIIERSQRSGFLNRFRGASQRLLWLTENKISQEWKFFQLCVFICRINFGPFNTTNWGQSLNVNHNLLYCQAKLIPPSRNPSVLSQWTARKHASKEHLKNFAKRLHYMVGCICKKEVCFTNYFGLSS